MRSLKPVAILAMVISSTSLCAVSAFAQSAAEPVSAAAAEAPGRLAKLNRRTEALLQKQIVPAYQQSDRLRLLKSLSTAMARMKPEQFAAFDERLRTLEMPSTGELLADGYLTLLTQGEHRHLPRPELREISVMVPKLSEVIDDVLDAVANSVATIDPLPELDSLDDYEGLFWDIHVLQNKLRQAHGFAKYGIQLTERATTVRARGSEKDLTTFNIDFAEKVVELEAAQHDLVERQLEFRLDRMDLAKQTLVDGSEFIEKLQAAFVGQLDASAFQGLFSAEIPPKFERERLQDELLRENVEALAGEIDNLSGDLKGKSELFYRGLHWWLRGRYGRGPEQSGLLKNVNVGSDDRLQFPLFMPEGLGKPAFALVRRSENDPVQNYEDLAEVADEDAPELPAYARVANTNRLSPDYPRRHYRIWQYEYRGAVDGNQQRKLTGWNVATTKMQYFY